MGMLLNLDIAASINPLRDTVRMFVNLLAMIFAASGMFPRNHPAFTQDSVHLGLGEVMSRAWSSLRPSVADIPRYLLFFGVLSSIVFCGGAIIIIAFSLLLGQAHADTTDTTSTSSNTFFSPVDDSHDLALAWVRFIFQGQPVYNYLSYGQVVPQLVNVQAALLKALAFYADAILVVAAFILFYHLTTMIISTAHHGEIMGKKADKVWAPIRLVIALGLLVPVAGGLSSGQMIVIKVSEWGSNLASQTWKIFMDALVKEDQNPINAYAPSAKKVVADTMMTYACQQAYVALTQQFTSSAGCQATNAPPPLNTIDQQNGMPNEPAMGAQVVTLANGVTVNYTGFANTADNAGLGASASGSNHTEIADNAMCGAWSTPPASSDTLGKQLDPLRSQLYGTMQTQAKSTVDKYLQYFIP
ncbi:MAG: DotA/TraY family protein, partial [Alphaproteobacteria bacterium]|nr:DotA/TraY family protein [Alphaproteobacteria bacterium]